ncbi:TPA: hypothetical protein VV623_000120 [Streptococcus pneumoniae]|nr:hypothetical protein [Streptococcus pneumoniae]
MTPEQLKASILQRAMEGKLVPQNPNDEPASELLKRIKAEKEKLISKLPIMFLMCFKYIKRRKNTPIDNGVEIGLLLMRL